MDKRHPNQHISQQFNAELERIGNRRRNISRFVACIVQGRDVRHTRFGQRVEDAANGQ